MREINLIIIHCSDSPNGRATTVDDIDDWHRQRGFARGATARRDFNPTLTSVGYHFVIYCSGEVHTGRSLSEIGAHAEGYNAHSIGICMIGRDKFCQVQWESLLELLTALKKQYPGIEIKGHYQVANSRKSCPNFPVPEYVTANLTPTEDHIWRA
jgi:N-acetylmuramoyl-L-alanine amidase